MTWLPFPFPQCPSCGSHWAYSYHHGCAYQGQIEVDPDSRQVRCESCRVNSSVWDTQFLCKCGGVFGTADVRDAIDDIIATTKLFAVIVEDNAREAGRARAMGQSSLRSWIQGVATTVGGHIGGLLGAIAGTLANALFGKQ